MVIIGSIAGEQEIMNRGQNSLDKHYSYDDTGDV